MLDKKYDDLRHGLNTAFIDCNVSSNLAYKPQFVSNDYREGKKVLTSIESELLKCDEFTISVAFITMGGITPLLQTLKELEKRKIPGRILTTDYLCFSEPKALKTLAGLKNISLRMYSTENSQEGFHTKGYMFRKDEFYRIIIGSSNMTQSALTTNKEWNTRIVSTEYGEYTREVFSEFENLWNSKYTLKFEDFFDGYSKRYISNKLIKEQRKIIAQQEVARLEDFKLKPNYMQIGFIENLKKIRDRGERKALLISATGTGKTFASAFALREDNPSKALFLVHREQIAKQAIESYRRVFGNTKTFGLLSGNEKDYKAEYLFSTMQMMAKKEIREKFKPDEFQTIVIDEAHRTGAESYQEILKYFKPKFLLGMTASPERTDGYDVFSAFDHNIAYEIRLQQALEEDILCPFHYFGITDLQIDDYTMDSEKELRNFNLLTSDVRVDYIIEQISYYGYSGDRVKGLIFCSSKSEAKELSVKFNERGFSTIVLTGDDSQEKREKAIERLAADDDRDRLDYIFTVDIFNEGVDIPEINQVIMLRPTQSPIVFVQQLGRGLRKSANKEYVVVLDFIGNYQNNFMIPIALSGDRTYNKDNIRRYVLEGERIIPGSSTVHFDEISKKRIFNSIDAANFSDIRLIRENYNNLKNKLGHIPALSDFDTYGEMDVCRIFDNNSLGSYYKFLVKYEKQYTVRLSYSEEKVIEFISKKLTRGKRIHELELLNRILKYKHCLMGLLEESLEENYGIHMSKNQAENIINMMTNEFPSGSGKKTYEQCIFVKKEENKFNIVPSRIKAYVENLIGKDIEYGISELFEEMLCNEDFYNIVKELVEFGIRRYKSNYKNRYQDTDLVLYEKYTYEDACRLLNWEHNEVPLNIGGYKYDKKTKTFPVFINYDKSDNISDTTKYEDHFLNNQCLIAISKSGRCIESDDVQNFLHAKSRGIDVQLFVRKNKDDKISKEFYYLGRMQATGEVSEFTMPNTDKTAVEIEWLLDRPVREDIYEYIING